MIGLSFSLMISGAVFGFAFGAASLALPFVADIDPLTATGIGFSLGLGAILVVSAFAVLAAIARVAFALMLAVAPLARWVADLVSDPLGRRQRSDERGRIDRLFPPPTTLESRSHVQT